MAGDGQATERANVTVLLKRVVAGDDEARDKLAPLVYAELKRRAQYLMGRESNAQSMQATMLVNDAYMRLVDSEGVDWESRGHFFALASRVMRRLLVERARARAREKRGGGAHHESLDESSLLSVVNDDDILRVEEALEHLVEVDPRQAEIVTMRFFGGMAVEEIAQVLGCSKRSIEREWTLIKSWLRRELST